MNNIIYTIGHSNHSTEQFIGLLKRHGITAVADVRSHPVSRHNPQFNRESLEKDLKQTGIAYVFLGKELGARSENKNCYVDGKVQYELLSREPLFKEGIERILKGIEKYRIALLCAEKDPLNCHRTFLVGNSLRRLGVEITHILANGELETQLEAEKRLLKQLKMHEENLIESRDDILMKAFAIQSGRIAYKAHTPTAGR